MTQTSGRAQFPGLTHRIIDQAQYSYLIAAVIGSAVIPTLIANAFFLPRYFCRSWPPPSKPPRHRRRRDWRREAG